MQYNRFTPNLEQNNKVKRSGTTTKHVVMYQRGKARENRLISYDTATSHFEIQTL